MTKSACLQCLTVVRLLECLNLHFYNILLNLYLYRLLYQCLHLPSGGELGQCKPGPHLRSLPRLL